MKAAAIPTDSTVPNETSRRRVLSDFVELIKARLTLLVLLTTAVGYYLAVSGPFRAAGLFHSIFGTALAAAGAAALNQWWERRFDALMHRTKTRPIPAGRMLPRDAIILGTLLSLAGIVYLTLMCNVLSAVLAAATIVIYIFAYTPLKRVSTFNTLVGAIPGALPPMIGWAAARGQLDPGAWSLFAILFFWQLPHFFAIAWMYREDYARAGFQMISKGDDSGARSASQSVLFCILLLIISGVPAFLHVVNSIYLGVELILNGAFIFVAMRFLRTQQAADARKLFLTSIIYLPLLLAALVLCKI
ncbi:MAG: protoheme IX farnesyltransferase [Chthoniobacterales bacterium]|nr:MAG: protoheme IX farnesyltransferase [Chthoniobacterales bacterium]